MSYKSLKDLYTENCQGIELPPIPRQAINCFLTEGGAAGHMAHPFDLPQVKTGRDLIKVFEKAAISVAEQPPAVKIDGVNASIKIVTDESDGSIEFGLDRGSNKPLDIKGVTISDLNRRFEEGHGMINVGQEVLTIFNKALPVIKEDLAKLGFFKRNLLLNMEYVKGSTNVIGYANNFLAIHGINEIYEVKSPIRGSISRASKEISYNSQALSNLIEKVNKIAKNYGFQIYGTVPATVKDQINFDPELNTEFAVKYTSTEVETKTLGTWLQNCKNPRGVKVTLFDGKKVDALSKFIYQQILEGTSLSELIKNGDKQMINSCVCGAVFYHATRVLGQKVLNSMTSPIGDISEQEGVVIRDKKISNIPFKITGNFIVRGLESKFASEGEEGKIPNSYLSNPNYMLMPDFAKQGGKLRVGAEEGY
jgi:hypothetical protein